MVLERAMTVLVAISYVEALFGHLIPGVTMFGFNKHPSQKILLSYKTLTTTAKTFSVTFYETSIEWSPSAKISGSTIGTKPLS